MRPPLNRLPAAQLLRMIASREVTCETVTHSFVDAVEQRESEVHAFAWFDAERALTHRARVRRWCEIRSVDGVAGRGEGCDRHRGHRNRIRLADLRRAMCRVPTLRVSRRCAQLAVTCSAKRSLQNSPTSHPDRLAIHTGWNTRPADRRAGRPRPSRRTWRRLRSVRKRPAR